MENDKSYPMYRRVIITFAEHVLCARNFTYIFLVYIHSSICKVRITAFLL